MHQLAIALHRKGYKVTGSDDDITDPAKSNLKEVGLLPPEFGWFPEKITTDLDAIVLGMHAKGDNPELKAAQALGIAIYSFPEYVYEVSKNKKRVVIAGSHGKTTITSMVMHILRHAGMEFDYLVGARVEGFDLSVRLTDAPLIVLEGDEYPASVIEKRPKILFYHPHISVLSGIAWDHINVFPTYENYFSQFVSYLEGLQPETKLFYNSEDREVQRLVATSGKKLDTVPYVTPDFHYEHGQPVVNTANGEVKLSVFGRHNLQNLSAAIKVCMELGMSEAACYQAISSFTGAARRLEKVMEGKDLLVYRDFAHAPSKLQATLNAVREAYPDHRLIACFELHTFSSLNEQFLSEYTGSMDSADDAFVFFSHHALQLKGLPDITTAEVKKHFKRDDLVVVDDKDTLVNLVGNKLTQTSAPTFLLLMSSGTFDGIDWKTVCSQQKQ